MVRSAPRTHAVDLLKGETNYILWCMWLCRESGIIYLDGVFGWSRRGRQGRIVAVFYCKCNNNSRVWAEFWWKPDKDKHEWRFFDDHKESESYGERVTNCTECGERLHRGRLIPA